MDEHLKRAGQCPALFCWELIGDHQRYIHSKHPGPLFRRTTMLYYAVVFLVIALIAGVLGFGGIAGASAGIAQILFFLFLAFLIISLVVGMMRRRT
jgi:uncharacterized membrane protein YtjA (UPF0391 family)